MCSAAINNQRRVKRLSLATAVKRLLENLTDVMQSVVLFLPCRSSHWQVSVGADRSNDIQMDVKGRSYNYLWINVGVEMKLVHVHLFPQQLRFPKQVHSFINRSKRMHMLISVIVLTGSFSCTWQNWQQGVQYMYLTSWCLYFAWRE